MSLPVPLAVRVETTKRDLHLTRNLRDLTFREAAIGGFASATVSIDAPIGVQPEHIAHFARIYVYDNTAAVVWEGRVEDLGVDVGADGAVWNISAMGSSVHAGDRAVPWIYVQRKLDALRQTSTSSQDLPAGSFRVDNELGGDESMGVWLHVPPGVTVAVDDRVGAAYHGFSKADQAVALIDFKWDSGITHASWHIRARTEDNTLVRTATFNVAGAASSTRVVDTNWTHGQEIPSIHIQYSGAGTTTGGIPNVWGFFDDLVFAGCYFNQDGTEKTSGYTSTDKEILASTVVKDLLGRLLSQYDGVGATVDTTSHAITQLAYEDGATPREILDDLMEFEPGYRWGAYESNSAGKYRFEWKAWPSTVRYEAAADDGFDNPSSASNLYNRATVFYTDTRGEPGSVTVTSTVDVLTDAGITREAKLDLQTGGSSEATQAGTEFLTEHNKPPAAGSLTVTRPVYDRIAGRWVQPWQILAGELIRVRNIQPRVDALTAGGRDGISVFKIASREYRASSAAAVLELDEYSLSTARALAAAARPRPHPRRKGPTG